MEARLIDTPDRFEICRNNDTYLPPVVVIDMFCFLASLVSNRFVSVLFS